MRLKSICCDTKGRVERTGWFGMEKRKLTGSLSMEQVLTKRIVSNCFSCPSRAR